jgi:hypothetical protein
LSAKSVWSVTYRLVQDRSQDIAEDAELKEKTEFNAGFTNQLFALLAQIEDHSEAFKAVPEKLWQVVVEVCVDHFEVLFELCADPFKVVEDLPEVLLDDV